MNFIIHYQFPILFILLLLGFIGVGIFLYHLTRKVSLLWGGNKEMTGDFSQNIIRRISSAEERLEEIKPRLELLERLSGITIQKVGFLRFNPFHDTGGDQSFILVLLDRDNTGVILSSLYMRDGARLYGKAIQRGASSHPLSAEEKKLLEETMLKYS